MVGTDPAGRLSVDRQVELGPGRLLHELVVITQMCVTLEYVDQVLDRRGNDTDRLEPVSKFPLVVGAPTRCESARRGHLRGACERRELRTCRHRRAQR